MSARLLLPLGLDALIVLVFAAAGRASHDEGSPVLGVLQTAWPFLAGVAVGWVVTFLVARRPPVNLRTGWPVWVSAVAVGMVLRHLTGRGTAPAFIVVATLFLGLFLLGWRLLVGLRSRKALV